MCVDNCEKEALSKNRIRLKLQAIESMLAIMCFVEKGKHGKFNQYLFYWFMRLMKKKSHIQRKRFKKNLKNKEKYDGVLKLRKF